MSTKKGYSSEVIIRNLRQAEVMLHEGKTMVEICRSLGISDSTYYKWRKEYGGMQVSQAMRSQFTWLPNSAIFSLFFITPLVHDDSRRGSISYYVFPTGPTQD